MLKPPMIDCLSSVLLDSNNSFDQKARDAFDANKFRKLGYQVIDMLATSLQDANSQPVLSQHNPKKLYDAWELKPGSLDDESIVSTMNQVIQDSLHLYHPRYIGHQTTSPLPLAGLCQLVNGVLNNSSGIFSMAPVHAVMEQRVIEWMCGKIGYDDKASGFLTSGGSLGNLTALLAARQVKGVNDIWNDGLEGQNNLAVLVSDQAHYSAKRSLQIMGLGKDNIILVKTNKNYQIDSMQELENAYQSALTKNMIPIAVVGSVCNTGPGTFDDLNLLADFCKDKNLWLHADAAHGGSTVLSKKYKHLIAGIERADSIIWDLHKMLLMPSLSTAVLFKNAEHSLEACKQDAPYLRHKSQESDDAKDGWDINIKRTFECTKPSMALGFYLALSYYGESFFSDYVTNTYDLAREFARHLEYDDQFELLLTPHTNIICFRYLPENKKDDINACQEQIWQAVNESGQFFIVKTGFDDKIYLRTTLINPLTTIDDLLALMKFIKGLA